MAILSERDALRPHAFGISPLYDDASDPEGEAFNMDDFELELKRLSATNQELLSGMNFRDESLPIPSSEPQTGGDAEVTLLRQQVIDLTARIIELEAMPKTSGGLPEEIWLERQREYETLLEEKSEVIRGLHQKLQEAQDCESQNSDVPASRPVGQAEEILRLKREMDDQRRQMEQDEADMMAQLRQMEMMMAKERAEMARQRQEMNRLQADLTREVELSSRNPELRDRLQSLRRVDSGKSHATLPNPTAEAPPVPTTGQKSSGFFRRMFQ